MIGELDMKARLNDPGMHYGWKLYSDLEGDRGYGGREDTFVPARFCLVPTYDDQYITCKIIEAGQSDRITVRKLAYRRTEGVAYGV